MEIAGYLYNRLVRRGTRQHEAETQTIIDMTNRSLSKGLDEVDRLIGEKYGTTSMSFYVEFAINAGGIEIVGEGPYYSRHHSLRIPYTPLAYAGELVGALTELVQVEPGLADKMRTESSYLRFLYIQGPRGFYNVNVDFSNWMPLDVLTRESMKGFNARASLGRRRAVASVSDNDVSELKSLLVREAMSRRVDIIEEGDNVYFGGGVVYTDEAIQRELSLKPKEILIGSGYDGQKRLIRAIRVTPQDPRIILSLSETTLGQLDNFWELYHEKLERAVPTIAGKPLRDALFGQWTLTSQLVYNDSGF